MLEGFGATTLEKEGATKAEVITALKAKFGKKIKTMTVRTEAEMAEHVAGLPTMAEVVATYEERT